MSGNKYVMHGQDRASISSKKTANWSKKHSVGRGAGYFCGKETHKAMKTRVMILLSALLLSLPTFAQKTIVTGIVRDSLTREGEPAAVLQFFRANDLEKPVAYTTTDEEGRFTQRLDGSGLYELLFSGIGRQSVRRNFTIPGQQDTLDLGEILIQDDVETLSAGVVTAQRTLVKMEVDKMTYDVSGDVDAKTSTVLDMLRKVPMVSVDGQDNITVNGSSSFQVYVDGKPNQMMSQNASTIFKVMPANTVKNIEVITNPGVKYDAEGVGGVLNIITNREVTGGSSAADGFYGTVMATGSNRGGGGGLTAALQKGKFAMSLTANGSYNAMNHTETDLVRTQDNGFTNTTHTSTDMKIPVAMVNGSASYEIDSLNLVSATLGYMHYGMVNKNGFTTAILSVPGADPFSYSGMLTSKNNRNNISVSADYQHLWANKPGRSLVVSYQYNGAPAVNNSMTLLDAASLPGFDFTDRKSDGRTGSDDHTVQLDFTTPLGSKHSLSTGAKFLNRHNSSDQTDYLWNGTSFVENPLGSLQYDFYNRIGAAYAELTGNYGVFSLKAGVRYEYTWQNYKSSKESGAFSVNYGNLVPSASLQWTLSPTQNIGLSYNMRISRPGISYLNPYVDTSDPMARSYGNPDLETERGHNISLVYNFYSPKVMVNATLRHSITGNGISAYSFYGNDNILNTTYGNIVQNNSTSLNAFLMVTPTNKTRIMLNGGFGYTDLRSQELGQQNAGWNYNVLLGAQQTLPWDLRLSANVIVSGRQIDLQGWSSGMSLGMLGLTKTFLDDRLSLSLSGMVPFAKGAKLNMTSHTRGNGFTSDMTTRIPLASINFQISWSFGKQGNYTTKKARRTIENESQLNSTTTAQSVGSVIGL